MENTDLEPGQEQGQDHSSSLPHKKRRTDRREEGGGLFGYSGPERRSGRDRRDTDGQD